MRRVICGMVMVFVMFAARPGPLAAEQKCGWWEVGRYEEYNLLTGEIQITIYYKYYCFGSNEA
jgi:uncharacterized membrane protein